MYIAYLLLFLLAQPSLAVRHSKSEKRIRAAAHDASVAYLNKMVKDMTLQEATEAQEFYKKNNDAHMSIKCGQRILALAGDVQDISKNTRLDLAQRLFEEGSYADAHKQAQEYVIYYPGTAETKLADLIAIQSLFHQQNDSHRDQENTKKTIEKADEFIAKYPQTQELAQVNKIRHLSYQKLVRSELNILDTQLNAFALTKNKSHLKAIAKRIEVIKEKMLPQLPLARKKIIHYEAQLAQAEGNQELVNRKKEELKQIPEVSNKKEVEEPDTFKRLYQQYLTEDHETYFSS